MPKINNVLTDGVQEADLTSFSPTGLNEKNGVSFIRYKNDIEIQNITGGKFALDTEDLATVETVIGNAGNDFIEGNNLDNNIYGGSGNDGLYGGLGADTYWFGIGDGKDTIFKSVSNSLDTIVFNNITANQLGFMQNGNDLVINVLGTDNSLTLQDWYITTDRVTHARFTSDAVF